MRNYMIQCALYCKGDYTKLSKMIKNQAYIQTQAFHGNALVIGDKDYPNCLYDLEFPPFVLFYEGNIGLLQNPRRMGVIGSRMPSNYALESTQQFIIKHAPRNVIISGLAKGIDTCAHRNALDFNTVAVLGCGIDVYYPRENKQLQQRLAKDHCVISEYPYGTAPKRHHFPFRNRLIAALSQDIYVMSAAHKSGTMRTVEEALKINRGVSCLPHQIGDLSGDGCNTLIKDGAGIITEHDIES